MGWQVVFRTGLLGGLAGCDQKRSPGRVGRLCSEQVEGWRGCRVRKRIICTVRRGGRGTTDVKRMQANTQVHLLHSERSMMS